MYIYWRYIVQIDVNVIDRDVIIAVITRLSTRLLHAADDVSEFAARDDIASFNEFASATRALHAP